MGDFPYVEWLARLYKNVGDFSGSWTDYIKVKTSDVILHAAVLKKKLMHLLCCMYTGTIPESADFIASRSCSSAELTLQNQPNLLPALLFYL